MNANDKHGWTRWLKFSVWGLTALALGAVCILIAKSRFESRVKRGVLSPELLAALGKGAEERCVTLLEGVVDKTRGKPAAP